MTESVQLALDAPPEIAAPAAATLADLLAPSGIRVGRTGSVVLSWPSEALPLDEAAWSGEGSAEADPIAFAFRHLHGRAEGWATPVDGVRARVSEWARAERLRLEPAWPGGATCAIAVVHEAAPRAAAPGGLRRVLRRATPADPLEAYARAAGAERAAGARSAIRSADLLDPEDQARVRALGPSLATGANVLIASRPGFRRGTAFPTRGFDRAASRVEPWVELPLLGEEPDGGLTALLEHGGAAALSVPIARFAGEDGEAAAEGYARTLSRLAALGAWLAPPEDVAERLYGA